MQKHERHTGTRAKVVRWVTICFGAYVVLYLGVFDRVGIHLYEGSHRALVLAFVLLFTFLNIRARRGAPKNRVPWYDMVFIILSLIPTLYAAVQARDLAGSGRPANQLEIVLSIILVLMILEGVRRAVSPILTVLGALFFLYPLFADKAPGFLERPSWGISRIAEVQYLYPTGIFGSTLGIVSSIIVAFILFGSFLSVSGAGKAFIDLALAAAGRFRGGPAKVAVLGSCLFGMINGSALANIATTGSITIPMMKGIGYRPTFAGAVEAVASTGGPMTPPVMGASIFLMMDFLGVSYVKLMIVAAVPAFLYYLGLLIMVDHEAVKSGLKGLPPEQIPSMKRALAKSWICLTPLAAIVFLLVFLHYSPTTTAMAAIAILFLVALLKKEFRMGPRKIADALAGSSQGLPQVGTAVAVAGILMGAFEISGIGLTLSQELVALAGGSLAVMAVLAAIACLIFGMGIPTVPVYLLGALFLAPALKIMGVQPIAAHFFILWIAHAALITPPVCSAAFLAGAIADAPLMATGWQACRLGIVVYLMSAFWIWDPAVLLIGSPDHIAITIASSIAGVYFASCGVAGRILRPVNWMGRVVLIGGAVLLFFPVWRLNLIGLAAVAVPTLWQITRVKLRSPRPA